MEIIVLFHILRILSILLMTLGLLIGTICTLFILYEFYHHYELRTSLNILIIIIFLIDCIRALICSPFESYVLIKTWNRTLINCYEKINLLESYVLILNFCRLTASIRSCFNVLQPFGFIAIAYERLRTIVEKNGNLNLNNRNQREYIRLKYIIIWISISLLLGISAGLYQAITYSISNTCYSHSSIPSKITMIIRVSSILIAAFISGLIYGRIFYIVKKYEANHVTPLVNIINNSIIKQKNPFNDLKRKDFRLAKNTFILFLSFFLCRIPSVIIILFSLIFNQKTLMIQCYLEEITNFSIQLTFLATITDPIAYIYTQPILKQKFIRFVNFFCKN